MKKSIPVTDGVIIAAFFGAAAEPYHFEVSEQDFDEFDNHGPGAYSGVEVPAPLAEKWWRGFVECKDFGFLASSRAGLLKRLSIMREKEVTSLPDELEARVAAEEVAETERATRRARRKELEGGYHIPLSHSTVAINTRFSAEMRRLGITDAVHPKTGGLPVLEAFPGAEGDVTFYLLQDGKSRLIIGRHHVALWTENPVTMNCWIAAAQLSREEASVHESWIRAFDAIANRKPLCHNQH